MVYVAQTATPALLFVLLLYQFGSIVAFAQVDRAVQELAVAEGARLLRARGDHHGFVAR